MYSSTTPTLSTSHLPFPRSMYIKITVFDVRLCFEVSNRLKTGSLYRWIVLRDMVVQYLMRFIYIIHLLLHTHAHAHTHGDTYTLPHILSENSIISVTCHDCFLSTKNRKLNGKFRTPATSPRAQIISRIFNPTTFRMNFLITHQWR